MNFGLKLLAFSLLSMPTCDENLQHFSKVEVREEIVKVSIELEIMDERESRYILSRDSDFIPDLQMLQKRYQRLKDAPKVIENSRFGITRSEINKLVGFNRSFVKAMNSEMEINLDRIREYEVVIREADELYRVWDLLRDAKCEFFYITVRRDALLNLKDKLGEENYNMGFMPQNVPVWRFREMKTN